MSNSTKIRLGGLAILAAGIGIGLVMAKTANTNPLWANSVQRGSQTSVAEGPVATNRERDDQYKTDKPIMTLFDESPNAIPLDPRDPSRDPRNLYRDPNDNPTRQPGPINIQKTIGGLAYQGIPTFFRAPVALGPADLKAGQVDVAIMGASVDMSGGRLKVAKISARDIAGSKLSARLATVRATDASVSPE